MLSRFLKQPSLSLSYIVAGIALLTAVTLIPYESNPIIALATAIIAIFTVLLALIGWRQSSDTRIIQRAYLSVEADGIVPFTTAKTLAHITIRNVGHLPAHNVKWRIGITPSSERWFVPPFVEDAQKERVGGVLSPGSAMKQANWAADGVITERVYDALSSDKSLLEEKCYVYVWGTIFYNDGFGTERFTRFCHRYHSRGFWIVSERHPYAKFPALGTDDGMHFHEYGNEAD